MASWEEKIKLAAAKAAMEAAERERARCLWVLDDLIQQLQADLQKKLLIESERHLTMTKLRIARALVHVARLGITSGKSPPKEEA